MKTKTLARDGPKWIKPRADSKSYKMCQSNQRNPPNASMNPWKWPEEPWVRLHADYAGPFMGRMYLIIIDACWRSYLPQQQLLRDSGENESICHPWTARSDCHRQWHIFHWYGFQKLMVQNSIQHIRITPYHPSSNGLTEWAVQSFKDAMKRLSATPANVETKILQFLFRYCITPHTTAGISPAELLMH